MLSLLTGRFLFYSFVTLLSVGITAGIYYKKVIAPEKEYKRKVKDESFLTDCLLEAKTYREKKSCSLQNRERLKVR